MFVAALIDKKNRRYTIPFLLCCIVAIVLACWRLTNPGLYYDEMLFVNGALGGKCDLFVNRRFMGVPLLLMDYIGALKAWLYYPVFALFGVNTWSVRFPAILLGTAGGAMLVGALWRGFDPRAAVAGAVMILLDPTMITHSRLDWGPNALMFFFRGLLVLSIVNWVRTNSPRWAWIAVVAAALGIFDKLNFIWMAGASMGSLVIVYADKLKSFARNYRRHALWLTVIAIGGLATAVLRGILLAEPVHVTWPARFKQAMDLIGLTLPGGGALDFVSGNGRRSANWFWLSYLPVFIVAIWGYQQIRKNYFHKRLFIWLVTLFILVTLAFVLTKTATGCHHASMLCGLWQMMLAPLVGAFGDKLTARIAAKKMALFVSLLCVAAGSIFATTTCIRAFAHPVNANWDPVNFRAAQLVKKYPDANFLCTDWGMATLAVSQSKTQRNVNDVWPGIMNRTEAVDIIKNIDRNQDTYIYTLLPGFENMKGNHDNLLYALQANNYKAMVYQTYPNWEGEPMLQVLKLPAVQKTANP